MNIPCPEAITCPCDGTPIIGFSSEVADGQEFLATGYALVVPPLGVSNWVRTTCMMFAESLVSQSAADMSAEQQALLCALNQISPYGQETGGGTALFFSAQATCSVTCPDGLPFQYTVPAGSFVGTTQSAADTAANTFACQQAAVRAICLSALSNGVITTGTPYTGTITATGGSLGMGSVTNNWAIIAGGLPPGLTFHGGNITGNTVSITGTPSQGGVFSFVVQVTDPLGDTMTKTFILQCTPAVTLVKNTFQFNPAVVFGRILPTGPYDTAWQSNMPASGGDHADFEYSFINGPQQIWNYQVTYTVGGTNNNLQVLVNGVLVYSQANAAVGTYTFNSQLVVVNCSLVTLEVISASGPGSPVQTTLQWQTPDGNCQPGYTVPVNGGWGQNAAAPPYDQVWSILTASTTGLTLNFLAPASATYNYRISWAAGASNPSLSLGGTPVVLTSNPFLGTFNAGGCAAIFQAVLFAFGGGSGNQQSAVFEWTTPTVT